MILLFIRAALRTRRDSRVRKLRLAKRIELSASLVSYFHQTMEEERAADRSGSDAYRVAQAWRDDELDELVTLHAESLELNA